jgi:hypothetical protein
MRKRPLRLLHLNLSLASMKFRQMRNLLMSFIPLAPSAQLPHLSLPAPWWPCGETIGQVKRNRYPRLLAVVAQATAVMAKVGSVLTKVVLATNPVADLRVQSVQSVQIEARA